MTGALLLTPLDCAEADMLSGPRDGKTFEPVNDEIRLNNQAQAVWNLMRDGMWRSLSQISNATQEPEASVSARLRDFRKPRFGGHKVDRRRRAGENGLFEYRLVMRGQP